MNSINLSTISDCYIGDTEANAIYFGSILVWQRKNNKVLCKYNVTSTTSTTTLFGQLSSVSSMSIDGVEQSEVVSSYTFDTTGEHTVLFTLTEGVTSIGTYAFLYCSRLTSVIIGNSLTSIGENAFRNCSGLTSITIPDSVTSIGKEAFYGCSGFTSITIGNSVTSIGDSAFADCRELTSINIPNSVTSIGGGAFRNCYALTSITIGNSVTSIDNNAFGNCYKVTSISVANNNQTYDSRNNCNAIIETSTNKLIVGCKNTIIPDSVTSIGNMAFYYCTRLTSITIPNSVTSIDNNAFYGCKGLTNITCNATTAPTISGSTFQGINSGGTLTVPAGSTGYDVWLGTSSFYLGYYNWNKVEQ